MGQRLELHALLKTLCPNVYFQPPESTKLLYPCIIYERDWALTHFAENLPYKYSKRYMLMVIAKDADDPLPDEVAKLPTCIFDRNYTANDLYHDVFKLFF